MMNKNNAAPQLKGSGATCEVTNSMEVYTHTEEKSNPQNIKNVINKPEFKKFVKIEYRESIESSPFPVNALPPDLRRYVISLSEHFEVSPAMPTTFALGILSTILQRSFKVRINDGWSEPLNLFLLVIAESGMRKSAVFNRLMKPVYAYEREYNDAHAAELEKNKSHERVLKNRIKKLEALKADEADEDSRDIDEQLNAANEELANFKTLHKLQLVADDVTIESACKILGDTGGKLTIASTEGGFFRNLRRYQSNQLDPFLKAYSGDRIIINRITRETNEILNPRLSVVIALQPHIMRRVLQDNEFIDCGLLARFLYVPCQPLKIDPDNTPPSIDEMTETVFTDNINNAFRTVMNNNDDTIITLSMGAHEYFTNYGKLIKRRQDIENDELLYESTSEKAWANKLHGNTARIAALLHIWDCLADNREITPIPKETIIKAMNIAEYYSDEAVKLFRHSQDITAKEDALYLWQMIKRHINDDKRVTTHVIERHTKHKLKINELREIINGLVAHGYIRTYEQPINTKGGRPSEIIEANLVALD